MIAKMSDRKSQFKLHPQFEHKLLLTLNPLSK
jgi:hypothetical protein